MPFQTVGDWTSGHQYVLFTGADPTAFQLPDARILVGLTLTLKNQGTGVSTISALTGQTIDGAATITIATQYATRTLFSDGANWNILSVATGGGGGGAVGAATYVYKPASGSTIQFEDDAQNVFIEPPANIAALTMRFPLNPADGQTLTQFFARVVTTFTMIAPTGTVIRSPYVSGTPSQYSGSAKLFASGVWIYRLDPDGGAPAWNLVALN